MNSAMYPCRRPAPSCCSRSSASVTSAAPPLSPAICHSTSGPACSGPRTRRNATIAKRLLSKIRVIDAVHPLFGQPLEVTPSGLIRRIGWIRVVLPDGRHRWVPQKATDLNVSACEARPNRDLPLVSVRTLIPLAEYVRARLSALGERFDETSGHTGPHKPNGEVCCLLRDPAMPTIGKNHSDPANAPNQPARADFKRLTEQRMGGVDDPDFR